CGEIDEKIRLDLSQVVDQCNRRGEVAVELAARRHLVRAAGAVEFELIDAVLAQQFFRDGLEQRKIFWIGQRDTLLVHGVPVRSRGGEAPLARWPVAAPRRKPDAGRRTELRGFVLQRHETIRKATVELPQMIRIVPTIVEQE